MLPEPGAPAKGTHAMTNDEAHRWTVWDLFLRTGLIDPAGAEGRALRAALDRSPAAVSSSGATWAIGGAHTDPALICAAMVAGNTLYIKAGGSYMYLCTFPGHNALMHGTFKFG